MPIRLTILCIALISGYSLAYNRGKASQAPKIAALEVVIQNHTDRVKAQQEAYNKALELVKTDYATTLASQASGLSKLETKLTTKRAGVVKDAKAIESSACVVPASFIRMHNIYAGNTSITSEDITFSNSGPENASGPTTTTLAGVAEVVADNYLECEARREQLQLWRSWYSTNKANYESAAEVAGATK